MGATSIECTGGKCGGSPVAGGFFRRIDLRSTNALPTTPSRNPERPMLATVAASMPLVTK